MDDNKVAVLLKKKADLERDIALLDRDLERKDTTIAIRKLIGKVIEARIKLKSG